MMLKKTILIMTLLLVASCSSTSFVDGSREYVESAIFQCKSEIEKRTRKRLSNEADHAYVGEFEAGYTVLFSHGAVGTFGKRSVDYKSVWACGVSGEKIVFLGSYPFPALIEDPGLDSIEDYDQDVKEYLYIREGDEFRFCCKQDFDEKNIDKHNPDFPWNTNTVS